MSRIPRPHKAEPKVSTLDPNLVSWHEVRQLPVKMQAGEYETAAKEMAEVQIELTRVREEKKAADGEWNAHIKSLDARLQKLAEDVSTHTLKAPVEVIVEEHYGHGWRRIHRQDLLTDDPDRTSEETLTAEEMSNPKLGMHDDSAPPAEGEEN